MNFQAKDKAIVLEVKGASTPTGRIKGDKRLKFYTVYY